MHANTFDLRVPKEAKMWIEEMTEQVQRFITKGGYRLLPESITFSNEVSASGKIEVSHTWKNNGVGLLPNNHPNWDRKYKVAFALLDTKDKHIEIIISKGKPITIERKQADKKNKSDFFYLPEQTPGEHTATIRIIELPAGAEYYLGQILVVGNVLR